MKKIIIIGNGSSGKSTLAKKLSKRFSITHHDLDDYFWKCSNFKKSYNHKKIFNNVNDLAMNDSWIIEGTYSHIVKRILHRAEVLIWLDLPMEECVENLKRREVEPSNHQISRTKEYYKRRNGSSRKSHNFLWEEFLGSKYKISKLSDSTVFSKEVYFDSSN